MDDDGSLCYCWQDAGYETCYCSDLIQDVPEAACPCVRLECPCTLRDSGFNRG